MKWNQVCLLHINGGIPMGLFIYLLLCWVRVPCGIYKSSYNISTIKWDINRTSVMTTLCFVLLLFYCTNKCIHIYNIPQSYSSHITLLPPQFHCPPLIAPISQSCIYVYLFIFLDSHMREKCGICLSEFGFISLNMMISSSIHFPTNDIISFFIIAE
jgi:hypothetical protein